MTKKEIEKFMAKFGAKKIKTNMVDESGKITKKNVEGYRICVCGSQDIPTEYLLNKKVGRNILIAIVDRINDTVVEQSGKTVDWIRKNFK